MGQTETISPRYKGLDSWADEDILEAFWEGQARAVAAVRPALPAIAAAARDSAGRLRSGGRLIYAGAGSSGRQAALDGIELWSTFGWPPERAILLMAEGPVMEPGAAGQPEDNADNARQWIGGHSVGEQDVLVAVAASGRTPFTCAAAEAAASSGALVVAIANNVDAPLFRTAHHRILLQTGAEVISGSTRMNAGTAHKIALGLLSSLTMTRLGHVHDGLMVSMRPQNTKLRQRAAEIVAEIAGCSPERASETLQSCGGKIKDAVLIMRGADRSDAAALLESTGGSLRDALARLPE